jgi:hypothetical protein
MNDPKFPQKRLTLNLTGPRRARAFFSSPSAPRRGSSELIISVDKRSPALPALVAQCSQRAAMSEVTFAESADGYRNAIVELGDRPANIPK